MSDHQWTGRGRLQNFASKSMKTFKKRYYTRRQARGISLPKNLVHLWKKILLFSRKVHQAKEPQFAYQVDAFHDRRVNAKINHIHERALRIAYHDRTSSFEELLITDHSVSIHQRNLQLLVTEIYRTRMNLNPCFMKEIFAEREILYNLRVTSNIYARRPRTTAYGLETVSFLGQNLWRDLPLHIKESRSVQYFKKEIKFWNFSCNCRLYKDFIANLGYI